MKRIPFYHLALLLVAGIALQQMPLTTQTLQQQIAQIDRQREMAPGSYGGLLSINVGRQRREFEYILQIGEMGNHFWSFRRAEREELRLLSLRYGRELYSYRPGSGQLKEHLGESRSESLLGSAFMLDDLSGSPYEESFEARFLADAAELWLFRDYPIAQRRLLRLDGEGRTLWFEEYDQDEILRRRIRFHYQPQPLLPDRRRRAELTAPVRMELHDLDGRRRSELEIWRYDPSEVAREHFTLEALQRP